MSPHYKQNATSNFWNNMHINVVTRNNWDNSCTRSMDNNENDGGLK